MTQLIASEPMPNTCMRTGERIETLSMLRGMETPVSQTTNVTTQPYADELFADAFPPLVIASKFESTFITSPPSSTATFAIAPSLYPRCEKCKTRAPQRPRRSELLELTALSAPPGLMEPPEPLGLSACQARRARQPPAPRSLLSLHQLSRHRTDNYQEIPLEPHLPVFRIPDIQ